MNREGNNFSQYFLLRGATVNPVSTLDRPTFMEFELADKKDGYISAYHMHVGMAANARPEFMECLPSQAIRSAVTSSRNTQNEKMMPPQSTEGFTRFHLKK